MTENEEFLRRLARPASSDEPPITDVADDVLRTIAQRNRAANTTGLSLWFAVGATGVTAAIAVSTLPAWTALHSPWTSLLHSLPEGLL